MDRGTGVPTVDAAAAQEAAWDWEVLQPDHMSSSRMSHDDGTDLADDRETEERVTTPPSSDGDGRDEEPPPDECKDIGVVPDETTTEPSKDEEEEEEEAMPEVTDDPPASAQDHEEEGEEKTLQSSDEDTNKQKPDDGQADDKEEEEEEGDIKKDNARAAEECVVFSVGKLKVNGIGALCSFGVAAATVCIFLIGGKMQHRQQQNKIQLQFCGDDKRIQQVVQQTSRLNQTMSSVMGGGGSGGGSTRANISFGGYYDGL